MAKTVKQYILENEIRNKAERIAKLEEIGCPKVVLEGEKRMLKEMQDGVIKVGGDVEALDEIYECREIKKGRGGKLYLSINAGKINYFPNARYGRYIKYAN